MSGKTGDDGKRDAADLVRDALRRAAETPEPDARRLVAAVPALMAEAARRRQEPRPGPLEAVVPMAARVIPRLAAVTAVLALLAAIAVVFDRRTAGEERNDLDSVLLDDAGVTGLDDLLLAAPPTQDEDHG